ncbi:peptidylprolyl isomerase [Diaphorobacter sp. NR2-3-3-1]|nr:peptidylprolyl isomerase [Diaphorobacter caeni]MBF5002772.1 peptidylprolyl isomerase [Diaphorobacter caeni]
MGEGDIALPLSVPVARVNGVPLYASNESPDTEALRQRACTELLRQQAQFKGLLDLSDQPMVQGAISQAAERAIEQLLERDLQLPEPTEEACERYHAAHPVFLNEQVRLRHVLFAVTPGVDVNALRKRAEACLLELRVAGTQESARFADVARELSNCPSGREGGELGWLSRDDCAPEFASEVFSSAEVGVLSRLVHSRFGLHVVEVLERKNGQPIAYTDARAGVVRALEQQAWTNAVRQYLQVLAGNAAIEGVQLDAADSPLVQ